MEECGYRVVEYSVSWNGEDFTECYFIDASYEGGWTEDNLLKVKGSAAVRVSEQEHMDIHVRIA